MAGKSLEPCGVLEGESITKLEFEGDVFDGAPRLFIAHREVLDSVQEWVDKQGVGVYVFFTKAQFQEILKRKKE